MFTDVKVQGRDVWEGSCDLYLDDRMLEKCRFSLEFDRGHLRVEDPTGQSTRADPSQISLRNVVIVTQIGVLSSKQITPSFAVFKPQFGGASSDDTFMNRALDIVSLAPVWRFVCNDELVFDASNENSEVYLRPGVEIRPISLSSNITLQGCVHGISWCSSEEFADAQKVALEIALGGPIRIFAKQNGKKMSLRLNEWQTQTNFRALFEVTKDGWLSHDLKAEGMKEVFCKVIEYQENQADGGENFRYAVEAFINSRSSSGSFVIQLIGALQLLEWIDKEVTLNHKVFSEKFAISIDLAKAIMILRNEFFHNPCDGTSRINLLKSVQKAGCAFESSGLDIRRLGDGNVERAVLNYVVSLAGYLLIREVSADVTPVKFIPGHGAFEP